jgi:hypothetical protein
VSPADSPTSMNLEFYLNGAGQDVVIVYNETGSFDPPSGVPPAAGEAFAGGTVAYQGSGQPFQIHTGLVSCTRYYYMMYSYYDGRYSDGLQDDDTTAPPPPPVILMATNITTNSFYANWEPTVGASNYRLDVSQNPYFTGGSAGSLDTFLFQGFEGGRGTTGPSRWATATFRPTNLSTDSPATSRIRTGSYSWQRVNGAGTLQLANSSIEGYVSRTVEVSVASISGTSANGAEATDMVRIFVALNGAAFSDTPDITIAGNNNARWGFNATRVVETEAGTPGQRAGSADGRAQPDQLMPPPASPSLTRRQPWPCGSSPPTTPPRKSGPSTTSA